MVFKRNPHFKNTTIYDVLGAMITAIEQGFLCFVMSNQGLYDQFVHSETFIARRSVRYFILKDSLSSVLVAFKHLQLESSAVTCSVHYISSCFSSVEVWDPLKVLLWLYYRDSKKRQFNYVRCICSRWGYTVTFYFYAHCYYNLWNITQTTEKDITCIITHSL